MKRPLLRRSSIVYLRRLAKELRGQEHGFFYIGKLYCNATASATGPVLRLVSRGGDEFALIETTLSAETAANATFTDAFGREICASRTAPRSTKANGGAR